MRRALFYALVFCAPLASGCDGSGLSTSDLRFETAEAEYAAGGVVYARLENASDEGVGYNLCFAYLNLEREAGRWETVPAGLGPDETAACTANVIGLAPGETAGPTAAHLPPDLDAGTYRLSTTVEVDGDRRRVVTNAFRVR